MDIDSVIEDSEEYRNAVQKELWGETEENGTLPPRFDTDFILFTYLEALGRSAFEYTIYDAITLLSQPPEYHGNDYRSQHDLSHEFDDNEILRELDIARSVQVRKPDRFNERFEEHLEMSVEEARERSSFIHPDLYHPNYGMEEGMAKDEFDLCEDGWGAFKDIGEILNGDLHLDWLCSRLHKETWRGSDIRQYEQLDFPPTGITKEAEASEYIGEMDDGLRQSLYSKLWNSVQDVPHLTFMERVRAEEE